MSKTWTDKEIEELRQELPHGSGIDSTWSVWAFKNGSFTFYNSYHVMNDNGFYDGWEEFSIRVFRHKKTQLHKLKGPLEGQAQVMFVKGEWDWELHMSKTFNSRVSSRYALDDYLAQCVEPVMTEHGIGFKGGRHLPIEEAKAKYPDGVWVGGA